VTVAIILHDDDDDTLSIRLLGDGEVSRDACDFKHNHQHATSNKQNTAAARPAHEGAHNPSRHNTMSGANENIPKILTTDEKTITTYTSTPDTTTNTQCHLQLP
jgi:hypothetical protein